MRDTIDRYAIKQEIGRGGMATVYYAFDPRVDRDVAIKVLLRELLSETEVRERFQREAKTIASLDHPAIVPIYDFGEDQGDPFIVMRYMSGGSLFSRLRRDSAIPLFEAALITERIASALDRAHSQEIVHRDLKPGNILFDQYNNAYLSDFGIVKLPQAVNEITQPGSFFGTPHYISPEQVVGEVELDGRADTYSLGVIVYEMLTGHAPYHADTPLGVAFKHVYEEIPAICEEMPELPPAIADILNRALAKNRNDRYPSAGEFSGALLEVAGVEVSDLVRSTGGISRADVQERAAAKAQAAAKHAQGEENPDPEMRTPVLSGLKTRGKSRRMWVAVGILAAILAVAAGGWLLFGRGSQPSDVPTVVVVVEPSSATAESVTSQPEADPPTQVAAIALDGPTEIAYVAGPSDDTCDLFILNIEDGSIRQLTFDLGSNRGPAWSPDGEQIVYRAKTAGRRVIYVIGAGGGEQPIALTGDDSDNYSPSWSPDGQRIAFVSERDGNAEIYVMNADGSEQTRLTHNTVGEYQPVWSPDGTQLLYYSGEVTRTDVYVMNTDGSAPMRLTDAPGNDYSAQWSPDGSRIVFVSERDGDAEIFVMNRDGTEQTALTVNTDPDFSPSWSSGGIVFVSRLGADRELILIQPDGSGARQLTDNEDHDLDPAWKP